MRVQRRTALHGAGIFLLWLVLAGLLSACAQDVPGPESYKDLDFEQPVTWPEHDVRTLELDNGVRLFLLENHELPLIDMQVTIRSGAIEVPKGKEGLADVAADAMRSGGSEEYPGRELNELLENRAAKMGFSFSLDSGSASLNCLKKDFPRLLPVFMDVLQNPRFPEGKIALAKQQLRTSISRRNDEQRDIALRKYKKLIYGSDSVYARVPQYKTVDAIEREDLVRFHDEAVRAENLYVGLVGDFDADKMRDRLRRAFSGVKADGRNELDFPRVDYRYESSVHLVDKPNVNQTYILMGHIGDLRRNPDYPELQVLNELLSGGFSGRLFQEIRTKRGLAYSVFGRYGCNVDYPGMFFVGVRTKSETTLEAIRAVRNELEAIRSDGVAPKEVRQAKERFLNSLVFNYDTPAKVLHRRMRYAYKGMDQDSFKELIQEVKGVDQEGVERVAREYLHPEKMRILLVGNKKALRDELSEMEGEVRELELSSGEEVSRQSGILR
ncbi:MAG: insulinase family protein [Desulfohalobiaceae bacterium]|nr:insulinase family protein [Desulfohalobiaceae bacterium]